MLDYGTHNDCLRDELADVVARWRGDEIAPGKPQPASMSEARRVTELCEQLYPGSSPWRSPPCCPQRVGWRERGGDLLRPRRVGGVAA